MLLKILFSIFVITSIEARPISYSGGSTMMAMSDNMKDSIYYHYSPTYKYSIGIESVNEKFFDKDYLYLRFTYLLNRKNTKNSQRNLYFQSAISPDDLNENFYGIHGDWETRKFFTGFGYKRVINNIRDFTEQYYQVGIAPYIGEYGDFHTWMMLKSKKNSLIGNWKTYPVLKFFKGDFLVEIGYDSDLDWDIHMMYRF
ncbi:hypothetical protein N9333_03550 [Gammaproteobacteria bacterium]|nr:hypothetical protein [Gammaproteobacteria bacterium]